MTTRAAVICFALITLQNLSAGGTLGVDLTNNNMTESGESDVRALLGIRKFNSLKRYKIRSRYPIPRTVSIRVPRVFCRICRTWVSTVRVLGKTS